MPKKLVAAFGVFDLLHPGHLDFLRRAKRLGQKLCVIVSRDSRVRREKSHQPVFNQTERLKMIRSLSLVDSAILGDPPGVQLVLGKIKPDLIAVGFDQKIPACLMDKYQIIRLPARRRGRYSASVIRKKLDRIAKD